MIGQDLLHQSWKNQNKSKPKTKHKSLIGRFDNGPTTKYLVESFVLNSKDRVVSRKGLGRRPDPRFRRNKQLLSQLSSIIRGGGKKVNDIDLEKLTLHFDNYVKVVNIVLSRIYKSDARAQSLGTALSEYRGHASTLLQKERDLCYQHNDDIKECVYERLHRNVLEQAGRITLADWTRRQLVTTAVNVLNDSIDDATTLMKRKRIPSFLIRKVRDSCMSTKNNGAGYHYTLGVLRQVRRAIDTHILDITGLKIGWRGRQRRKVASLLKKDSHNCLKIINIVQSQLSKWAKNGYPFVIPKLRSYSLDFTGSTENSIGQGYWFTYDHERENEVLLHLKLPPGINGSHNEESPYKKKTLTLRLLDWLPRSTLRDRRKAEDAKNHGDTHRAKQLQFRAAKFEDMHHQLNTTIRFQHLAFRLSRLKQRKFSDSQEILRLEREVKKLRESRRSAPPRLILRGHRVILQIPFLSPKGPVRELILGERKYTTKAGADRGLRSPMALSVEKEGSFKDLLINVDPLIEKREKVRKHAYSLTSELTKKKNNWDRKRSGQSYPTQVHRLVRQVSALWSKVRRLDREIARQVASRTVWFCEEHRVKKLFIEDLRSFKAHAGSKDLSYRLSSNIWGKIIDTVRYMRESLGHSKYSVWTVNPWYTSQICHVCGERGVRVEDETSISEKRGSEYFYCGRCDQHFHADINAARNIIHVQDSSVVSGGTKDTRLNLSNLQ